MIKNRLKFGFYNGVNYISDLESYDNWLPDPEYSVVKTVYIEVEKEKNYLFEQDFKELTSFNNTFTVEQLQKIAEEYQLQIREHNDICYVRSFKYISDRFYIIDRRKYIILFGIGGSRAPESIYIYGCFQKTDT